MSAIRTVTLAGVSGSLGSQILKKLQPAGGFSFTGGVKVVDVDFTSVEVLTSALNGQDAVVDVIGSIHLEDHIPLIDAAFAAWVKRLISSEFGCYLDNLEVRKLPPYANKVKARKYIEEKSKGSPTTYTYVCTIAFLDWGLERDFILDMTNHKAHIIGTGDELFSAATLPSSDEAVAAVFRKPEETKNRTVRVQDIKISLKKLLALAKKATPGTQWDVSYDNLDDLIAKADERLAKGLFDMKTFGQYILKGTYRPGMSGAHESTENERLGLKEKTEDDVFKLIQTLLRF